MSEFMDDLLIGGSIMGGIVLVILLVYVMAIYVPYLLMLCLTTGILWAIGRVARETWKDMT